MKRKNRLLICSVLVCAAAMLCSCSKTSTGIIMPSKSKVKSTISKMIEDNFTEPEKVSSSSDEAVWEVTLPDRGSMKVQFTFYKSNTSVGLDGSEAFNYWTLDTKTDYVWQIISNFDNSLKASVDEKYSIVPDSTVAAIRYDRPTVTVHSPMTLDEFTSDVVIGYINECMELYDIKAVQLPNYDDVHNHGVESLMFIFVMDNILEVDGTPLEYSISLDSSSLSSINLSTEGKCRYMNENWVPQQLNGQKNKYLYRIEHKKTLDGRVIDG